MEIVYVLNYREERLDVVELPDSVNHEVIDEVSNFLVQQCGYNLNDIHFMGGNTRTFSQSKYIRFVEDDEKMETPLIIANNVDTALEEAKNVEQQTLAKLVTLLGDKDDVESIYTFDGGRPVIAGSINGDPCTLKVNEVGYSEEHGLRIECDGTTSEGDFEETDLEPDDLDVGSMTIICNKIMSECGIQVGI